MFWPPLRTVCFQLNVPFFGCFESKTLGKINTVTWQIIYKYFFYIVRHNQPITVFPRIKAVPRLISPFGENIWNNRPLPLPFLSPPHCQVKKFTSWIGNKLWFNTLQHQRYKSTGFIIVSLYHMFMYLTLSYISCSSLISKLALPASSVWNNRPPQLISSPPIIAPFGAKK